MLDERRADLTAAPELEPLDETWEPETDEAPEAIRP
jgi:hypothetical protein